MNHEDQRTSGLPHDRPAHWDELYGPHGQPPGYTPPMTATNSVQSPLGLRVLSAVMIVFAAAFTAALSAFSGLKTETYALVFFMIALCLSMAAWGFILANKRAKWLKEQKSK